MNQGEFRVYSPDGSLHTVDTITVMGGRFEYEMECYGEGIIVIVMPNHYELPVFVKPGRAIDIKADATHIKDVEITGSDANEQMSEWRKDHADLSPEQQKAGAEQFIRTNPTSVVSRWMLYKYFIRQSEPDMKKVKALIELMKKAGKGAPEAFAGAQAQWLINLSNGVDRVSAGRVGDFVSHFTATDIYGKTVSYKDYQSGYAVITLFANYNYESQNIARQLRNLQSRAEGGNSRSNDGSGRGIDGSGRGIDGSSRGNNGSGNANGGSGGGNVPKFKVLSISIDPSREDVKSYMHRDSLPWQVVCDQKMWSSPLVRELGFSNLPDNIVLKDGKVIARRATFDEIERKIKGH